MKLRQTCLATALLVLATGCARSKPAPTKATAAQSETSPWVEAIEAEVEALSTTYPGATVRIAVVDVGSGDLLASHGPVDTRHAVGSTVKSFTIAAALAAGVKPETPLHTGDGTTTFGAITIRDYTGHGTITVQQALARSSNVAIVRLVEQIGESELYRRVADVLPLPARADLDEAAAVEVLFGGRLTLTTEELARGYAVLAAGGVDPRSGSRLVDAAAAAEVVRMLEYAVTAPEGTGNAAAIEGRRVAGKTGTAPNGEANTALFVGLTESHGRPLVVAVVVDGVPTTETGSTVAAPSFARLVRSVA
jgi:cell division protein FtsI (penicillin-binding protein 3)